MEEYHSELDFEIPEIDGQKSLMGERDNSVMFYNDIVVMWSYTVLRSLTTEFNVRKVT